MPAPAETRQVVEDVVGTKGDDTVFEYVVSILEDGEFEFGPDGEDAFEAFGAVLVQSCTLRWPGVAITKCQFATSA